ncbi:DUF2243 domain-containing protein [Salicibibacter halophilus]|nr:DUF2243 domain-containing protein [Salicibibacter halophilus]
MTGIFLFADATRKHSSSLYRWIAGIFIGLGSFQLFDGMVSHKVLQVHQI